MAQKALIYRDGILWREVVWVEQNNRWEGFRCAETAQRGDNIGPDMNYPGLTFDEAVAETIAGVEYGITVIQTTDAVG